MPYELKEKLAALDLVAKGMSMRAVSKALGLPKTTVLNWCRDETRIRTDAEAKEAEPDYTAEARADIAIESAVRQASHYKKLYQAAVKYASNQESISEAIRDSISPLPVLKPLSVKVKRNNHGQHSLVLQLSDLHVGEVVDKDEMGGISEYNIEVFRQRLGFWTERVIMLLDMERASIEISEVVVLLDGDFGSGNIHPELERTNEITVMAQASYGALLLAHALAQIAQHVERMRISCTGGNHGRIRQKKEFKERNASWDTVAYQQIAHYLANYDHIEFDIPKAWWRVTTVQSTNILHWHGDGVRGWAGFPWYGIDRAIKELRQTLQPHDVRFDMAMFGHFHVPVMMEGATGAFYCNGNWKGGDEFAFGALHKNVRPMQNFLIIHEDAAETAYRKIVLTKATAEHAQFLPEHMPDVWADAKIAV